MNFKIKFIKGSWLNDDVDLLPTIKLRTGSKTHQEIKVTAISIALCWLKWGIMFSVGKIESLKSE